MAHVKTLSGLNDAGFDADRSLLVLPVGKTSTLYLVEGGSDDLVTSLDDPDIASVENTDKSKSLSKDKRFTTWERGQEIHKLTVKGLRAGTTTLRAMTPGGLDWIEPIEVRVTTDPDYRQSGNKGAITPELRDELQAMPLRDAVIRVAEDQMNSKLGRNGGGFGRYTSDPSYDWCGAFAWYCWNVACTAHGVPNPWGNSNNSLLSVQKAISYTLQTDCATILRYEGGDPYGNSFTTGKALKKGELERQAYIEIDANNPLEPADIVLVRAVTANGWKHVAMVYETPTGDDLTSIDGNQGNPCIRLRTRSLSATVNNGKDYALVFLHVDI